MADESKSKLRRPELARAVRGCTKAPKLGRSLYGDAFVYFSLDIMLWSYLGCFVDVNVGRGQKTVDEMCRLSLSVDCLRDLRGLLWENLSMSYYYGSGCLQKVAFRMHLELRLNSKDSLAGRAFLHMFPRSRPRTWTGCAAKSSAYKRNVMCLAAAFRTCTHFGTCTAKLMARRPALTTLPDHKDVPHTSPRSQRPSKGYGTHHPLHLPCNLAHKTYAAAPATGIEALSLSRPVASIISSCVQPTSSIDERRYQLSRKSEYTFLWKKEAIFGDVLCALLQCPPACFMRWERKSKTSL